MIEACWKFHAVVTTSLNDIVKGKRKRGNGEAAD